MRLKGRISLIILLIAVTVIVPVVNADNKNININITSPKEGEVYHVGDVIPDYIAISVIKVIDAPHGIQNITISNGIRETSCGFTPGNHSDILCDIQLDTGVYQKILITALDIQGNRASIMRNYSLELIQLQPPKTTNIIIHGNVSDPGGHAISGVEVVLEPLSKPQGWEDYVKKSTTADNGTFNFEDAVIIGEDYERNISLTKEGYIPIKKKIIVLSGNLTGEQNFIINPQNPSVSGFGFLLSICAVFIGLMIIISRKEG